MPSVSLALGQAKQQCRQPVPHGGEGKLFDDGNQLPQARTHYLQYLESHLRVFEAEGLEVSLADKQQRELAPRGHRGRISATVKYRQLRDRTTRALDGQDLLAAQVLGTILMLAVPALGRRVPRMVSLGTRRLSDFPPEARERIMPLLKDMCGYLAVLYSLLFTLAIRELIRTALVPGARPSSWLVAGFLAATGGVVIYYLWRIDRVANQDLSRRRRVEAP